MSLKAVGNKVIVDIILPEEETESGIVLTQAQDDRENVTGKVVAIGNGEEAQALGLAVGQTVMFNKFVGEDIETSQGVLKVLHPKTIFALITE